MPKQETVLSDEVKNIIANHCYQYSTCFDEKTGKRVDCVKDCAYVKNLASAIREALAQELEDIKIKENITYTENIRYNQAITDCQAKLRGREGMIITPKEVIELGIWEKICKLSGINPRA